MAPALKSAALLAALALSASAAVKSDQLCNVLMCIKGTSNDTHVFYELTANTSPEKVGWMALGFGQQMSNSPMVIVYPNPTTGEVTVSQRQANGHVMPTVVPNPPRIASLSTPQLQLSSQTATISFVVPADKNSHSAESPHIYAYSSVHPTSFDEFATIVQHDDSGPFLLNLDPNSTPTSGGGGGTGTGTGTGTGGGGSSGGGGSGSGGSSGSGVLGGNHGPFLPYQKQIIAHGAFMGLGFMILLPIGAILARYRTLYPPTSSAPPPWFKLHFTTQAFLSFPLIIAGFALAVSSVHKNASGHFNDPHKKAGLALFILYLFQLLLGLFIHYFKPTHPRYPAHIIPSLPRKSVLGPRPIQNYGHAILGLTILGLAFWNVREGYKVEWPAATGRGYATKGVNRAWIVFVVIWPVVYVAGLGLVRRQYKIEKEQREKVECVGGASERELTEKRREVTTTRSASTSS